MNKLLLKNLLLFISFFYSINSVCQYQKLSSITKISVLTCGAGGELYSIYGHTAIRIKDETLNLDVVYNYGNFDFATENFYAKFVKGDLKYFVAACYFNDFMAEYRETNRDVFEQVLKLNDFQKQQFFDELNTAIYSDERFYTYKFIDKNCTTMVLDKVNKVFGQNTVVKVKTSNESYRTVLYSYVKNHFWENFGINIIFGTKVDNQASKLFLPDELMQNIKISKTKNIAIAEKTTVLNKKTSSTEYFSFWNSIFPYSIILLLIAFFNKKGINIFYFSVLGLAGFFFSLVVLYSFHEEIYYNYNALLFNPSLLFLIYHILSKNNVWIKNLCYFNLACLVIYLVILINKAHLIMMFPMIFCSATLFYKLILSNKKLLPSVK